MQPALAPPLARPLALAEPRMALRALAQLPYPFLLHSALEGGGAAWSFFGADPFAVHRGAGYEDAAAAWRRIARRVPDHAEHATGAPFTGGMVGYWAYDFGRRLERIPAVAHDDLALPDFVVGLYDVVGAFEHASGRAFLFASGLPLDGDAGRRRASERLEAFARRLEAAGASSAAPGPARRGGAPRAPGGVPGRGAHALSTFAPDAYRRAVESVREHIRRGDIFQANLSQRWTVERPRGPAVPATEIAPPFAGPARTPGRGRGSAGDDAAILDSPGAFAAALYDALARRSPAPYAACFDAGDHAIASASPERFLTVRGRAVTTRPIKGTRPRGPDQAADRALREELLASAKDRAENVMIVDVLRNDLGRVCETGSVETPSLCELETFPQVHHLTSTVTGILRTGLDALDLLHAAFPGGSITGAPKIRAMEILDALEPVRRHVYTGSLGYLDWRGNADWSIAIRTALVTPAAVHFAAGGGITADSDPDAEYRETLDKAEGLRLALGDLLGPLALEPDPIPAR